MNREKPYGKRMTGQMAREYGSRHAAEVTRVVKGAGEPQAVTYPRQKSKVSKEIIRKEQVDVYDIILSHLLDEGYASTPEAAKNIMVNMSEDWIESILG
jgi:cystathionine beta-lyase/cystathionine gamma-synthase